MRRDRGDDGLAVLLSAVSSVLRGTGAIAKCESRTHHDWHAGSEVIVEATIAVSKINSVDADAIRAAVVGYAPNKARLDEMEREIVELRKDPDRAELERIRREHAGLASRLTSAESRAADLARRLAEVERRASSVAPTTAQSARIAALEGEVANLRKQLAIGPPVQDDGRDPGEVRASLLELT